MSFAINPSLNHINVPPPCVHEIYRSTGSIQLPDARFRSRSCEAYICLAKNEKVMSAYVALLETEAKNVIVYTSDFSASEPAAYPKVFAEAEAFVKEMGFTMEAVNLNFSPAMREVIIMGFRVMKPPPPKKTVPRHLRPMTPEAAKSPDKEAAAPKAITLEAGDDLSTELESLRLELASAKAAIQQITAEKIEREKAANQQIASLKSLCEQEVEARKKVVQEFAAEAEKIRREAAATVMESGSDATLKARAEETEAAAREAAERFQAERAALTQQLAQAAAAKESLEQKLAGTENSYGEKFRLLADENKNLLARLEAEEKTARAANEKIASLELIESSWKEAQQREEELNRSLKQLEEERTRLQADLQQREETYRMAQEELTTHLGELETELATAREEAALTAAAVIPEEIEEELAGLRQQKEAIETEYVRLATESREREQELNDALAAADGEIQRLANELETNIQVAALEHSALRAELRRLITSGAAVAAPAPVAPVFVAAAPVLQPAAPPTISAPLQAAPPVIVQVAPAPIAVAPAAAPPTAPVGEAPLAAPPPPVSQPQPPAVAESVPEPVEEEDTEPDRPIAGDKTILAGLISEFGGFTSSSSGESTEFAIDPALTTIAYNDPEEIAVLLYSSNSVQAVPDNSTIQRCKGYIVALKQAAGYRVYVAWYLTESKRVVVCTPSQQPATLDECIATLQDAVAYFEIIGLMMEAEDLGESVRSYNRVLRRIPVLSRVKAS